MRQGLGGTGQVLPAGRPLDRAALQVYRLNTLFLSTKGMERAKVSKAPTSWAEFNDVADKMKARHDPAGQWRQPPGRWPEIRDCARRISPRSIAALMQLDSDALKGRKFWPPSNSFASLPLYEPEHRRAALGRESAGFRQGDMGMVLTGGWAQGQFVQAGAT